MQVVPPKASAFSRYNKLNTGSGDPRASCSGVRISYSLPRSVSFSEVMFVSHAHFKKFPTVIICRPLFKYPQLLFDHMIPCLTQNCQIL
ncbi:hypothetical protein Y032_0017g3245 [Ancylostoma ceylanicum]|uniref:Uncharacterized protein n=1 Tax=Ancylostoma ceylanicum TaxID=53326 RepID=A0A016V4S2_9BILA|nr:hypothetical protein Y032_0017g3245 [Ancylostoma ceylanicum]